MIFHLPASIFEISRTAKTTATTAKKLTVAVATLLGLWDIFSLSPPVFADTTVVPSLVTATEGNSSFGLTSALTAQQVYGSTLLTNLNVGDQITGIAFRLNAGEANSPSITTTNFDIYLGMSNFAPGSLTSSFAGNQGADTVLVRSGAYSPAAGAYTGGGGANPFGTVIAFSTPYTYKGGDLLLTLSYTRFSGGTVGGGILLDGRMSNAGAQVIQAFGYNAASLTTNSPNYALVSQLQIVRAVTPSAAPEPGSLALLLPILGTLSTMSRVIRKRERRRHSRHSVAVNASMS